MKPWWPSSIIKPQVRLTRPRFATPQRPPDIIVFAAIFIAVVFILGGNIYTLVRTPPPIAAGPGGDPILIAPGIDIQLGMEGLVASVIIIIGVVGIGLIFFASRYVFQPGYATRLMALGMILSGVAFLVMTFLMLVKTG